MYNGSDTLKNISSLFQREIYTCYMTHLFWREAETQICTKTLMQMFVVGLLIIVPKLEGAQYPPAEEGIDKLWYIHTVKYYSKH